MNSPPPRFLRIGPALLCSLTASACAAQSSTNDAGDSGAQTSACTRETDFRPIPGLGKACSLGGSRYVVLLEDGSRRITHWDPPDKVGASTPK